MPAADPTASTAKPSEDKFEFFEDGFDGFPRRLPENCVEYILFVLDGQMDGRELRSYLDTVRRAAIQLSENLTKDYIWQRDSLQLNTKNDEGLVYLQGTSYYGDSVEDEWLIVYLLRELTKSFRNLWVRVFDSDGEFLLVEAANVLPSWLSPEVDSNRVWINHGELFIIPAEKGSGSLTIGPLALTEAVSYLKTKARSDLVHSTFVEAEAFYRLEKYPGHITECLHHSLVTIPRKLAWILHEKPAAMAPAVEAFYLRDPLSMKSLFSTSGKLSFPPEDLVTVSVKFTKILFAQLKSQRFVQPPIWDAAFRAAETSSTGAEQLQKVLDPMEVGMKITSGFEMLAVSAETKDSRTAREVAILLEDLEEDGDQILPNDISIQAWPNVGRNDDESWMHINYEDFEKELSGKGTKKGHMKPGLGDTATQADLQKIVSRFESFLNNETAGLDGVELNEMDFDDNTSEDDQDEDEDEDSEEEDKDVSFDEEQFARMMREMMGMPSEPKADSAYTNKSGPASAPSTEDLNIEVNEDEAIRELAAQIESELTEHGAIQLDPTPKHSKALDQQGTARNGHRSVEIIGGRGADLHDGKNKNNDNDVDNDNGEVDIDYNLAKNLLESFKGQAGLAGPAGNLLGMMGMQLPRDEEHEQE